MGDHSDHVWGTNFDTCPCYEYSDRRAYEKKLNIDQRYYDSIIGKLASSMKKKVVYLIGSMSNPQIPVIANELRILGYDVFDDWWSAGPETDIYWMKHECERGRSYTEALAGYHAQQCYAFDKLHLDRADAAVLVLPAGKSGHLELGYVIGKGTPGFILLNQDVQKFDIMYNFATVVENMNVLAERLKENL